MIILIQILFLFLTTVNAYIDNKEIVIKQPYQVLFTFSIGNEGVVFLDTKTPQYSNQVHLGICPSTIDYNITTMQTEKQRCKMFDKQCYTFNFNETTGHSLPPNTYYFIMLSCNTTMKSKFTFQYTIHVLNGSNELPMNHIYSPQFFLLMTACYTVIFILYIVFCFIQRQHIKQIHKILIIVLIVLILRCVFESLYFKIYSDKGIPSKSLYFLISIFQGLNTYFPVVLCSSICVGYSVLFDSIFHRPTQPFIFTLLSFLLLASCGYVVADIKVMILCICLFFVIPLTGKFFTINSHFLTMYMLSDGFAMNQYEIFKEKISVMKYSYVLMFVRVVLSSLYDIVSQFASTRKNYYTMFIFELLIYVITSIWIFKLRPQKEVFGEVNLDDVRNYDEEQPRRRKVEIMTDVKEKIDTEQIVFFSYATSLDLKNQEFAPIGVGYLDV